MVYRVVLQNTGVVCQKRSSRIPKMVVCARPEMVGAKSGLTSVTSRKGNQTMPGEIIADCLFGAAMGDFIAWSPTAVLAW